MTAEELHAASKKDVNFRLRREAQIRRGTGGVTAPARTGEAGAETRRRIR